MIDLTPGSDHQQIIDSVRGILARPDAGGRAARWQTAAGQGWLGLGLQEELGGAGFGVYEEALVAREFGRALSDPSLLATLLATQLVTQDKALLARIVDGDCVVSFALAVGTEHFLLDGDQGQMALIVEPDLLSLVPIPEDAVREKVDSMDPSGLERIVLSCAPIAIGDRKELSRAHLLATASLVGVAEGARDMATEYAKVREQFGRPIGAFQAIAHRCADNALRAEAALAQLLFAAIAHRDDRADALAEIAAASVIASDAAFQNATSNIQIHGGIGYSAEIDAHRYLKRALLLRQLAGEKHRLQVALIQNAGGNEC